MLRAISGGSALAVEGPARGEPHHEEGEGDDDEKRRNGAQDSPYRVGQHGLDEAPATPFSDALNLVERRAKVNARTWRMRYFPAVLREKTTTYLN